MEHVSKQWAKGILGGILGLSVALAGGFLMAWSSKFDGFAYWFGTIAGLVIFCVALAYAVEFSKLLISGVSTKAIVGAIRESAMKEWMRVFLAFLSITGGICLVLTSEQIAYYLPVWMPYCGGIVLFAAGITFFWTRSKFYKG